MTKEIRVKIYSACKWFYFTVCMLIFLFLVKNLFENQLDGFDNLAYGIVTSIKCEFITGFFKLVTNMAGIFVLLTISFMLIVVFKQKLYWASIFINLLLTGLMNLAFKQLFLRIRPTEVELLVDESGYSFPSGHSMVAAAFYGFIIYIIWKTGLNKWLKILGTGIAVSVILIVGMSRIYLGVHFASDVIAGFSVSVAYLIVYTSVINRYFEMGEKELTYNNETKKLIQSFLHAFCGIKGGLNRERNLTLHFAAMGLVVLFGVTLQISITEWCICVVLFGLVIGMELMNTAIEFTVDMITMERNEKAEFIKDVSAGAVLACVMAAAVGGMFIFFPKLWVLVIELI